MLRFHLQGFDNSEGNEAKCNTEDKIIKAKNRVCNYNKREFKMKKWLLLLSLLTLGQIMDARSRVSMDDVWKEFRANHPYGFQTVGLKHNGDEHIFVISEPSESVSYQAIESLFGNYNGTVTIKKDSLGYDGWLADVVGAIRFKSGEQEASFKTELFNLLYGTPYKAYYTDLDKPSRHSYFAPYKYNLNYSITAAELKQWFVEEEESFGELSEHGTVTGNKSLLSYLSSNEKNPNKLLYSRERGFVVWLINPSGVSDNESFRLHARKFALDTDLIIGAFGTKGKTVAIVAREREIPVDILPPLRIETLSLLATTNNESLAQSYERHNVFASKLPDNNDVAPIYLSDELWHTEYGNLLNVTDQMLKSWSENGDIDYKNFLHPKPIDWAFERGAVRDLDANQLTYNWNTAGAGYVIEGDNYDIFAVNRTGSLPVSYIPGGMEGKVDQKVYDAEELAYDFFSGLNSPELARVVQYATFYQIFSYFKGENNVSTANKRTSRSQNGNVVPDYSVFDGYVERLLNIVQKSPLSRESNEYKSALSRFAKRYRDNNAHTRLKYLIDNDPYGEFADYLQNTDQREHLDSLLNYPPTDAEIEEAFLEYLNPNLDTIKTYIRTYEKAYGSFPINDAAHYIVSPREIEAKINDVNANKPSGIAEYEKRVNAYNQRLDSLKDVARSLSKEIDSYNHSVNAGTAQSSDRISLEFRQTILNNEFKALEKERTAIDILESGILVIIEQNNREVDKLLALMVNDSQQKALGALNWLLTDPTPYNVPSGVFFASRLTSHRLWMKSPSMACSTSGFGYGGHNLDAHVTPIKTVVGLGKNKCRISFKNGKPVVCVAKENIARVTRSFLRKVERQFNTDKIIDLPEPPKNRDKGILVAKSSQEQERGFNEAKSNYTDDVNNTLTIRGKVISNEAEMFAELSKSSEQISVTMKPYSEREVLVHVEGKEPCVIDRSELAFEQINTNNIQVGGRVVGDNFEIQVSAESNSGNVKMASVFSLPKAFSDYSGTVLNKIRTAWQGIKRFDDHFRPFQIFTKSLDSGGVIPQSMFLELDNALQMNKVGGNEIHMEFNNNLFNNINLKTNEYQEFIFIPAA